MCLILSALTQARRIAHTPLRTLSDRRHELKSGTTSDPLIGEVHGHANVSFDEPMQAPEHNAVEKGTDHNSSAPASSHRLEVKALKSLVSATELPARPGCFKDRGMILGCRADCMCGEHERCYPKYLVYLSKGHNVLAKDKLDVGQCDLTLEANGVIGLVLFFGLGLVMSGLRACLFAWDEMEQEMMLDLTDVPALNEKRKKKKDKKLMKSESSSTSVSTNSTISKEASDLFLDDPMAAERAQRLPSDVTPPSRATPPPPLRLEAPTTPPSDAASSAPASPPTVAPDSPP